MSLDRIADAAEQHMLDVQAEACCARCDQPVGTVRTLAGFAHRACPPTDDVQQLVDAAVAWHAATSAVRQSAGTKPHVRRAGQTAATARAAARELDALKQAARTVAQTRGDL